MKKTTSNESAVSVIDRENDIAYIMGCVTEAECCSVVGVSNVGKSVLLRSLSLPEVHKVHLGANVNNYMFVHVDFNLASQVTEQGFYEVILRNILQVLATPPRGGTEYLRKVEQELQTAVQQSYQTVIAPNNPFLIPLAFEDSMQALCTRQPAMLVLLLDEFDDVFAEVEPRVFVRLRALKDRHWAHLCYVTATGQPLSQICHDRQADEFCELFAAHLWHLLPLAEADAHAFVRNWATHPAVQYTEQDIAFIAECAGGHPGLLQAVSHVLARAREEAVSRPLAAAYERVRERLDSDTNVRLECAKLWNDLTTPEQEALIDLLSGKAAIATASRALGGAAPRLLSGEMAAELDALAEKGIVRLGATGGQVFSTLFAGFARRQQLVRRRGPQGIRIDVESGDVWVDGKLAPLLTDLEYKLLLLLYGNLDRICDKYKIVESVWGENYIDEVDDARIEKLVSRLREKLESKPGEPKYLQTIRGRGYKLVSPE
jgi:hypothetical protein